MSLLVIGHDPRSGAGHANPKQPANRPPTASGRCPTLQQGEPQTQGGLGSAVAATPTTASERARGSTGHAARLKLERRWQLAATTPRAMPYHGTLGTPRSHGQLTITGPSPSCSTRKARSLRNVFWCPQGRCPRGWLASAAKRSHGSRSLRLPRVGLGLVVVYGEGDALPKILDVKWIIH